MHSTDLLDEHLHQCSRQRLGPFVDVEAGGDQRFRSLLVLGEGGPVDFEHLVALVPHRRRAGVGRVAHQGQGRGLTRDTNEETMLECRELHAIHNFGPIPERALEWCTR